MPARVLGINGVFHDPAAALVVDGEIVAASEEERFTRRKHGKVPVPFSTWELPENAARWCLEQGGLEPSDLDAVAYSYDPELAPPVGADITAENWEGLRSLYVRRAPLALEAALPGLAPAIVRYVRHHVAHAASAHLASPHESSAVLVMDGRGESASYLAGHARPDASLRVLAVQPLPHSLGRILCSRLDRVAIRGSRLVSASRRAARTWAPASKPQGAERRGLEGPVKNGEEGIAGEAAADPGRSDAAHARDEASA